MTWEGFLSLNRKPSGFKLSEITPEIIRRAKAIVRAWDAFLRYRESRLSGMIRDELLTSSVLKKRKASLTEVALETGMTVSRAKGAA